MAEKQKQITVDQLVAKQPAKDPSNKPSKVQAEEPLDEPSKQDPPTREPSELLPRAVVTLNDTGRGTAQSM